MEKREVARLYDAYAQDVYRLALSYLYHCQDAEDVCHSVFLTLVEKDITLFSGSEKAWLLKCAANACKDHLKSFWRQNRQELDENMVFTDSFGLWWALCHPNTGRWCICTTTKDMPKRKLPKYSVSPAQRCRRECSGRERCLKRS